MWEDEVKPSELKVNILNGHELPPPESPSRSSRYLARGSITRSSSFSSDIGTITTAVTSPATSKKRSYTEDSDTEVDELDAYTSDGEWTVIETVMRRRNSKSMGPPKTPRKERRTSTMPSPSKLRATVGRIEGSRQDSKEENIFTTPSASSSRTGLFSRMSESPNSISHSRIPNSSNYSSNDPTTIWENSSTCAPSHTYPSTPLSREFAAILRQNSCQLPKSLEASLESLLDRYWKQAEGYRRA